MKTLVLVCLIGLLAASFAEEMEVINDSQLERKIREAGDAIDSDAIDVKVLVNRQKRLLPCGMCHPRKEHPIELSCKKLKWVSYQKKSRCGWWRRRHTCYKTRHHFIIEHTCCPQGKLFNVVGILHVCVNKAAVLCGGFFMDGPQYPACRLGRYMFCNPFWYNRHGSKCYRKR